MTACGADDERPGRGTPEVRAGSIALVASDVERAAGVDAAIPDTVGALHLLGAGLYAELSGPGDNLALSPYSVGVALAMTQNGAHGRTLEEMTAVLGGVDPERLNGGLNALTGYVESLTGKQERLDKTKAKIALRAANTLFGEATTTFEPAFLDALARDYGAGLQAVDFKGDYEAARVAINDWTSERTEGRIEDLVPDGVLEHPHPAGARQRALPQGALGGDLREGAHRGAELPPPRRVDGADPDDVQGDPRGDARGR